jgi:hypothetical protein
VCAVMVWATIWLLSELIFAGSESVNRLTRPLRLPIETAVPFGNLERRRHP